MVARAAIHVNLTPRLSAVIPSSSSMRPRNRVPPRSVTTLNRLALRCQPLQDPRMRRIWVGAASAGAAALTITTAVLATQHPDNALAGGSAAHVALQAVAATLLLVSGALGTPLLLAAAVAVDLQALPLPYAGGAVLFTASLVFAAAAAPLAVSPSLDSPLGAGAIGVAVVWAGLLPTTLLDARGTGC